MSGQSIRYALRKRFQQAEIESLGAHDMRRSCATSLLAAGADLSVVARILGHASVTTTMIYDMRPERAAEKAVKRLTIPYYG